MSKFQGPSFKSVIHLNDANFRTAVHKTWAQTRSNKHLSQPTLCWTGVFQPLLMNACYMSLILQPQKSFRKTKVYSFSHCVSFFNFLLLLSA